MNKYKVTITVKVIEVDIEATSIAHAKELLEKDIKSRVHKGDDVVIISSLAELQSN